MKIAIVELSISHEECIYSQLSFLQNNQFKVSLIVHPVIRNQISYDNLVSNIDVINFDKFKKINSLKEQIKIVKKLSTFDKIIFNTASSSKQLRNISLLLLFFKVECIGILHNTKKLKNSFTQKIISCKIKKYFVLSDYLKQNAEVNKSKISVESFYPIYFPKIHEKKIKKNKNEIWFCIPGRVEFSRRNYLFLVDQLEKKEISKNIKFLILGNINTKEGLSFKRKIDDLDLTDYFVFFERFIENATYYSFIKASDYILPLLKQEDYSYLKYKISGTFNLAYGFKKKIFFNEFYKSIPDLNSNGISYNKENFSQKLNSIDLLKIDELYSDKKWHHTYQLNKFIKFINS